MSPAYLDMIYARLKCELVLGLTNSGGVYDVTVILLQISTDKFCLCLCITASNQLICKVFTNAYFQEVFEKIPGLKISF